MGDVLLEWKHSSFFSSCEVRFMRFALFVIRAIRLCIYLLMVNKVSAVQNMHMSGGVKCEIRK